MIAFNFSFRPTVGGSFFEFDTNGGVTLTAEGRRYVSQFRLFTGSGSYLGAESGVINSSGSSTAREGGVMNSSSLGGTVTLGVEAEDTVGRISTVEVDTDCLGTDSTIAMARSSS